MPLTLLWCGHTNVRDLSPLKGMPLISLNCGGCPVGDLSPLTGMKLGDLNVGGTPVRSLASLKAMSSLSHLVCSGTQVNDLTPLAGLPLRRIHCNFQVERDAALLKSLWTLETINDKPAIDFWKQHDAKHTAVLQWIENTKKLPAEQQVEAVAKKLQELNPGFDGKVVHKIQGGVVDNLAFPTDAVTDISPVRALPKLRTLGINGSALGKGRLNDLTPLRGLSLRWLYLHWNPITDLTPLKGMPLEQLTCDFKAERDADILRSIKTLGKINGMPAAEFWKAVDVK